MILFFSDTYAIFWREIKRYQKSKRGFLIMIIQPCVWLFVVGNTFVETQPIIELTGFVGNYIVFITPGIVVLTSIFTCIYGGMNTLWDRNHGFMNKVLTFSISRLSIVLGKIASISSIALFQSTLVLGLAIAIGVPFPSILDLFFIVGVLAFYSFGFSGLSITIALLAKSQESFWALVNFLGMPLFLVSPALFPLSLMPEWLFHLSTLNPTSYAVLLIREGLGGIVDYSFLSEFLILGLFSISAICLVIFSLNREIKKAF